MGVKVRFHRGAWCLFINHQGRRKFKKVGDREAALRLKRAIEERLGRADLRLPAAGAAAETFRHYAEVWLAHAGATLKASTVRFYRDNLENHLYPSVGHVPLGLVARRDVKRLLLELRGKGLRPKTVAGIVRTLSTILSEAVEDEKLPANPALRPGRLQRQLRDPNAPAASTIDPYTREELELLVATAGARYPEWAPFLLCAARTGLRLGELRALEWGDMDWRQRFIQVERNFVEGVSTVPKSGRARRVDMSLHLRAALRVWRRRQSASWLARGLARPALVFPSEARTPLDDSKIRKALRAIAAAAEVRQRRSIVHVLRHTFGSLLIQQGEPLTYVKEQLGHASIQVTVDVYGHLLPGGNRSAVDRLDTPAGVDERLERRAVGAGHRNPGATGGGMGIALDGAKSFVSRGEPGGNRTPNPQIKSHERLIQSPQHLSDSSRRGGES